MAESLLKTILVKAISFLLHFVSKMILMEKMSQFDNRQIDGNYFLLLIIISWPVCSDF